MRGVHAEVTGYLWGNNIHMDCRVGMSVPCPVKPHFDQEDTGQFSFVVLALVNFLSSRIPPLFSHLVPTSNVPDVSKSVFCPHFLGRKRARVRYVSLIPSCSRVPSQREDILSRAFQQDQTYYHTWSVWVPTSSLGGVTSNLFNWPVLWSQEIDSQGVRILDYE